MEVNLPHRIEERKDLRKKVPRFREFNHQFEAVSRAGNDNQTIQDASLGQAIGHLLRLLEGHPLIVRPVNEEDGRVIGADVLEG